MCRVEVELKDKVDLITRVMGAYYTEVSLRVVDTSSMDRVASSKLNHVLESRFGTVAGDDA